MNKLKEKLSIDFLKKNVPAAIVSTSEDRFACKYPAVQIPSTEDYYILNAYANGVEKMYLFDSASMSLCTISEDSPICIYMTDMARNVRVAITPLTYFKES